MSKAQITFKYNNETGKRDIHIDYESDPSSQGFEHEDEHRQLVDRIIDLNALKEPSPAVEVSREKPGVEQRAAVPEEADREKKATPKIREMKREK